MTPDRPLITYIRVSTSQQGRSGLGIEAQRQTLEHFARAESFSVAREFVEDSWPSRSPARYPDHRSSRRHHRARPPRAGAGPDDRSQWHTERERRGQPTPCPAQEDVRNFMGNGTRTTYMSA